MPRQEDISRKPIGQRVEPEKQREFTPKAPIILLSLEGLLSGTPFLKEEDFLKLADELQESPPPELTPEALSLVVRILRGDGETPR